MRGLLLLVSGSVCLQTLTLPAEVCRMQSIMLCQLHQSPAWEAESLVMQGMISQVSDDAKQAIFGFLSQESFQNLSIYNINFE